MKCEICKIIETQGLDPSVHDWWHCPDAGQRSACRSLIGKPVWSLRRTCRRLQVRWTRLMNPPAISKPQAIGRELKLLSYTLAAHIGARLK